MPETPVASNAEVTIGGVPLNPGEEPHQAGMQLEHERRRDSELADLRAQVDKLTGGNTYRHPSTSISEERRRKIIKAKRDELVASTRKIGDRWEGLCAPFTVVNLNPVKLSLTGELQDQSIPAAGSSPKAAKFKFRGREFSGSYVTFTNPKVWAVPIGMENIRGVDCPVMRADFIPPIGIAHQFYQHYVVGAIDAEGMGGLIMFEGDAHVLDARRLEKAGKKIRVPLVDQELSTTEQLAYKVEERLLDDVLADTLEVQRQYAEKRISEGHGFANSRADDIRNQLNNDHIRWHNFAVERGWKLKAEDWASKRLQAPIDAKLCPSCRTQQDDPQQHFCAKCNAPFDALKSYLAGMPVPNAWLERYEGADWDAIMTEKERRDKKRALLEGGESEPKRKGKSPATT